MANTQEIDLITGPISNCFLTNLNLNIKETQYNIKELKRINKILKRPKQIF